MRRRREEAHTNAYQDDKKEHMKEEKNDDGGGGRRRCSPLSSQTQLGLCREGHLHIPKGVVWRGGSLDH